MLNFTKRNRKPPVTIPASTYRKIRRQIINTQANIRHMQEVFIQEQNALKNVHEELVQYDTDLTQDILSQSNPTSDILLENISTQDILLENISTPDILLQNDSTPDILLQNDSTPDILLQNDSTTDILLQNDSTTYISLQNDSTTYISLQNDSTTDILLQNDSTTDISLQNDSTTDILLQSNPNPDILLQSSPTTDISLQNDSTTDILLQSNPNPDILLQSSPTTDISLQNDLTSNTSTPQYENQKKGLKTMSTAVTYLEDFGSSNHAFATKSRLRLRPIKNKNQMKKKSTSNVYKFRSNMGSNFIDMHGFQHVHPKNDIKLLSQKETIKLEIGNKIEEWNIHDSVLDHVNTKKLEFIQLIARMAFQSLRDLGIFNTLLKNEKIEFVIDVFKALVKRFVTVDSEHSQIIIHLNENDINIIKSHISFLMDSNQIKEISIKKKLVYNMISMFKKKD